MLPVIRLICLLSAGLIFTQICENMVRGKGPIKTWNINFHKADVDYGVSYLEPHNTLKYHLFKNL